MTKFNEEEIKNMIRNAENFDREMERIQNHLDDCYSLIYKDGKLLIVHEDYFGYENAIVFTVGHPETDWPNSMLKDIAIKTVKLMNKHQNELSR